MSNSKTINNIFDYKEMLKAIHNAPEPLRTELLLKEKIRIGELKKSN